MSDHLTAKTTATEGLSPTQSEPTDLTGYVSPFLSRTGIRMPVRLELYRHTYACMTGVIQAYICLYDWSYTGIRMPVQLELYRHTYACTTGVRQAYVLQPISGQNNFTEYSLVEVRMPV